MTDSQVYAGAALLGAVAGMRSMSAPAIVCGLAHEGPLPQRNKPLETLAKPAALLTTALLAAGEIVADKLPFVPARISPGPLVTRGISGAMTGAAICSAKERSVFLGIVVGACAAVGSTYAAYHLRRYAGKRSGIPDPALAVVEDTAVFASGWLLFKTLKTDRKA